MKSCIHPDDIARVEAALQRRHRSAWQAGYTRILQSCRKKRRYRALDRDTWAASFRIAGRHCSEASRWTSLIASVLKKLLSITLKFERASWGRPTGRLRAQIEQREIAEAEFQHATASDAIADYVGVAHDFNNLLSVVLTNARMLSRNLGDPGDQEVSD